MSQKRTTIRPLCLDDAKDIYELMHMPQVLWGTSLLPSTTLEKWQETIEKWVYDERMHTFVAEVQEKVAGIINSSILKSKDENALTLSVAAVILIVT